MEYVRAKFKVLAKKSMLYYNNNEELVEIELSAVTQGSKENEAFFKWTPSGNIKLAILPKPTADYFELGKEYYIDFKRATDA